MIAAMSMAAPAPHLWSQRELIRRQGPTLCRSERLYTRIMIDELTFRRHADHAIESLKQSLFDAEEEGGFEIEEQNGVLNVVFENPPAKFVITPNTPARQIWISALSTSFKLDWSDTVNDFVFLKESLSLKLLVARLINQQLGSDDVVLN
jgi:CyaY protein